MGAGARGEKRPDAQFAAGTANPASLGANLPERPLRVNRKDAA